MSGKHIEIERKFLVEAMPDLSRVRKSYIQQGYITHSNDSVEVRLRQKGAQTYELDVFAEALNSLMLVEVGFSSIEQANSFQPADWFGREVTVEKNYINKGLTMNPNAIESG